MQISALLLKADATRIGEMVILDLVLEVIELDLGIEHDEIACLDDTQAKIGVPEIDLEAIVIATYFIKHASTDELARARNGRNIVRAGKTLQIAGRRTGQIGTDGRCTTHRAHRDPRL